MQLLRLFPIASTTVLLTVWQPIRLNFSVTSSILPAVAQTLDEKTGQFASPIQLAQTNRERKAVLAQAQPLQERDGEGRDRLFQTGVEQFYKGQLQEALATLEQVRALSRERGDKVGEAATLIGIAETYTWLARSSETLKAAQQALAIYQELGERSGKAEALYHIGDTYLDLQQIAPALDNIQQSLAIRREVGDRQGEGRSLGLLGVAQVKQGQVAQGLQTLQQSVAILRESVNTPGERKRQQFYQGLFLAWLGYAHLQSDKPEQASELFQQALGVSQEIKNPSIEMLTRFFTGLFYEKQKQPAAAIEAYQRSLVLAKQTGARTTEANILNQIGSVYVEQKQYPQAREYYQQTLKIVRETNNRKTEAEIVLSIATSYQAQGYELLKASSAQEALKAFQQSLAAYQEALAIAQDLPSFELQPGFELKKVVLWGIRITYSGIGHSHDALSQYAEAIAAHQQELSFAQQAGDREAEFGAWSMIVNTHYSLAEQLRAAGKFQQALETFQQGLKYGQQALAQADKNPEWKRQALDILDTLYTGIAILYFRQGQYPKSIEAYQQILAIKRQLGDRGGEALTLKLIAGNHARLGEFRQALELYDQALTIVRELQDPVGEAGALVSIGKTYDDLGQYSKAEEYYQQALAITRQQGALIDQATILNNLGGIYGTQGEYERQLKSYQEALQLNREVRRRIPMETPDNLARLCSIGASKNGQTSSSPTYLAERNVENQRNTCLESTRHLEAVTLNNIGLVYSNQGSYPQALENYQQSLTIARELQNRYMEASILSNIGSVYKKQGAYPKALESSQQVLEIFRAMRDKASVGNTLNNIGTVYADLGQYQQAISYYQQALDIAKELGQRAQEANSLSNIGNIHSRLGNYDQALKSLQQALKIRQEIRERDGEMVTLNNIGSVHYSQGRYAQALEVYQQALAIAQKIGDRNSEATYLGNIGTVYSDRGNYPEAMSYQQQALEIRSQIGDRAGQTTSLINIGLIHFDRGRYPQALEFSQQALTLAKELGTRQTEATALNNMGTVYSQQSNFSESMKYFEQALAINKEIGDRSSEAATLRNIATNYGNQGEYAKALELLQQALSISQTIGDKALQAIYLNSIGLLYNQLGQYPQALEYRNQALGIAREIGSRPQEVNIVLSMAVTYRLQKDYTKAEEQSRQSLTLAREIGSRANESRALGNLGYVYERQGKYALALESLQQALNLFREMGDRYGEGFALGGLGLAYQASGRDAEALKTYQQARAIQQEIGDKAGFGSTLTYLGKLYNSKGQYAEAETSLFKAVEIWETLRGSGLNDENKISLFEIQADTYRYLQQSLIAQNKTDAALEVAERGRARAFVELLAKQFSKANIPLETKPPSLQQIQQIAQQQKATLVQYSIIPEQSLYIWVISPNGKVTFRSFDLKSLGVGATTEGESLQKLVAQTLESLGVGEDRDGIFEVSITNPTADPQLQTKSLKQLHQLLIQPIADLLPTDPNSHVIFIPHQDLFRVPFPALMDSDGKYLIEKHTILTAPSIQVLDLTYKQRQNGSRSGQGALVVGNPSPMPSGFQPLKGAEKEALDVAQLLKTQPLIGSQATEPAVLQQLPKARIIHLATHGTFNEQQPLLGGVALAQTGKDTQNDGLLTAEEIFQLNREGKLTLNAELLVLSACNTGRGRITGDGVIGLSRSFIAAGIPSVIVSLWSVPDAPTASLMSEFYTNLYQKKLDKAQALRMAMLKMMEKHRDNPRAWAAFTLIGEAQ